MLMERPSLHNAPLRQTTHIYILSLPRTRRALFGITVIILFNMQVSLEPCLRSRGLTYETV
jgi:hypothetical protein